MSFCLLPVSTCRFPFSSCLSLVSSFPYGVRRTINKLLAEWGGIAVVVYFVLFFGVLGGFWVAIVSGFYVSSSFGKAGAFTAAYIATKLTQPLRIEYHLR